MDSNPFISFKINFFLKANFIVNLLIFGISINLVSCSNTAPAIVNCEAKVVFDFENEKDTPKQKMNLFLKMTSDVRRTETINVNHNSSGLKWIVTNPMISQADNYYYAGYTNLQGVSQSCERLPKGEYSINYMDSQGREEFSSFNVFYDEKILKMKYPEFLSYISKENPQVFVGVYSKELNLIYYGKPRAEWNITKEMKDLNSSKLFSVYNDSAFFRIFFIIDSNVFVMPKIEKVGTNIPTDDEIKITEQEERARNER